MTRGGKTYWAGSHRLLNDFGAKVSDLLKSMVEEYERSGKSLVYFGGKYVVGRYCHKR